MFSQLLTQAGEEWKNLETQLNRALAVQSQNSTETATRDQQVTSNRGWDLWNFNEADFPRTDVSETGDAVLVRSEIPGVKKENINISVESKSIVLSGQGLGNWEERGENFVRRERHWSKFTRRLPLPSEVDPDGGKANYSDGVLEVWLPKTSANTARKITVE